MVKMSVEQLVARAAFHGWYVVKTAFGQVFLKHHKHNSCVVIGRDKKLRKVRL